MKFITKFLLFSIAGTIGFVVDVGVLYLLKEVLGPYLGRLVSFVAAVATTFAFNRWITFAAQYAGGRLLVAFRNYFMAMLGGGFVNYATYAALIATQPLVAATPVIGVAAGSIAGLAVNFMLANNLVFRPGPAPKD